MRVVMCVFVVLGLFALPAVAQDKKGGQKDKPADNGQFDDLFGSSTTNNNSLDAMKKATEGMNSKKAGSGLAPKVGAIDNDAKVVFLNVFAAERIIEDKKLGCQPGGKLKQRISTWTFDEVPARASASYQVCMTVQSNAGREMTMRIKVVDARGQKINSYEDSLNFRGRTEKFDHVVEFEAPTFKMVGPHFYVIDLDGKEAARMPLFTVKVEGQTGGAVGSTPSDLPPKTDNGTPGSSGSGDNPLKDATSRDP